MWILHARAADGWWCYTSVVFGVTFCRHNVLKYLSSILLHVTSARRTKFFVWVFYFFFFADFLLMRSKLYLRKWNIKKVVQENIIFFWSNKKFLHTVAKRIIKGISSRNRYAMAGTQSRLNIFFSFDLNDSRRFVGDFIWISWCKRGLFYQIKVEINVLIGF